jgi:hypothetical protein
MRKNSSILLTLAGMLTLLAAPAWATIYDVDLSGPTTSGPAGTISIMGTIEVDVLGPIALSNIVDWSLTFTSPSYSPTTLIPSNSMVGGFGGFGLTATTTELLVFIPPSDASGGGGFFFSGTAPFPVDVTLQYQGGDGSPTQLILSHMVKAIVTDPDDQSVATIGNGGNFVLGIAAVPEASSALLLGVVSLGGAAVAIGRRAIRS